MERVPIWPCLTSTLPGVGGVCKRQPEDFGVEELPLYAPSGAGTHVYFEVEKREQTTYAAIEAVAKALNKSTRDVGYAGLKDAQAVTRQVFSVEHVDPLRVAELELPKMRIVWVNRHTNKLKLGHLRGNRFTIKVRECDSSAVAERARAIVEVLQRRGVPNYFGEQRFGATGQNAAVGRAVLREDYERAVRLLVGDAQPDDRPDVAEGRRAFAAGDFAAAAHCFNYPFREQQRVCRELVKNGGNFRKAWRVVSHDLRRLIVSAVQSELFNEVLARRIDALDQLREGDLAMKHVNGACFRVDQPDVEQPRCMSFEISPTGPIFGPRMTDAGGTVAELEQQVLKEAELTVEHFAAQHDLKKSGERRPLRVPLTEAEVQAGRDQQGNYLQLRFALPPGSYATELLREVMKK
ncbi:MAG: tRNA pseudouridine synthase D [Phycisphaerae bacterium]|nr:tRNA pseudouridine synthase D [Phycisphaerae bacterium]